MEILKKSTIFSIIQSLFFSKKTNFCERFEKSYWVGCILHQNACFQRFLIKLKIVFFRKTILFFSRRSYFFNVLRDLTKSVASYDKLFTFGGFWKSQFCSKNESLFLKRQPLFSTFLGILLIQLHPTSNFLSLAVFKKVNFFRKTHIFYLRKPNFEHFENFYSFSRIVQQICYL